MNKPITVAKKEFEDALVELVNQSGLPAFVVKASVASLAEALSKLEEQQLQQDMKTWKESQEAQNGEA